MADRFRLKDGFGPDVPARIAAWIVAVDPGFPVDPFVAEAVRGYEGLELMARAQQVSDALARALPADRREAVRTLHEALPSERAAAQWRGMEAFALMPFVIFVRDHGLDCFEESMALQRELTKRFTAEFSIRAFVEHRYVPTMRRLAEWAHDENHHVRRLVSEGTRPRLPWAPRLRRFVADPTPILPLLDVLRDDPSDYVRRSVANNLNDIAKDHPDVTIRVARAWWPDGGPERRALVRHALRTLIKQGDARALAVLGYERGDSLTATVTVEPAVVAIGDSVVIAIDVANQGTTVAGALVDLAVDFVKARGGTGRKVFKGAEVQLLPGARTTVRKRVSVAQHTTRTHHAGAHTVVALVNGEPAATTSFVLVAAG